MFGFLYPFIVLLSILSRVLDLVFIERVLVYLWVSTCYNNIDTTRISHA